MSFLTFIFYFLISNLLYDIVFLTVRGIIIDRKLKKIRNQLESEYLGEDVKWN